MIINGNSLEVLKTLDENSIDSIVTDPPYGLSFMGKKWDYDVPSTELWQEVFRVLKPGGHLLAFAGTRTQHRMAVNIEDAGFEIRDMIAWVYGSGFPKSHNVAKGIDVAKGKKISDNLAMSGGNYERLNHELQTDEAKQWQGWGTALKPALEPITVARKPIKGSVAQNVLEWGTGGINIDGCRVVTNGETPKGSGNPVKNAHPLAIQPGRGGGNGGNETPPQGRFPANLIHDGSDEVVGLFPDTKSVRSGRVNVYSGGHAGLVEGNATKIDSGVEVGFNDSGSAARFFYKANYTKEELCESEVSSEVSSNQSTHSNTQELASSARGATDTTQPYSSALGTTQQDSVENAMKTIRGQGGSNEKTIKTSRDRTVSELHTNTQGEPEQEEIPERVRGSDSIAPGSPRLYYVPKASKSERNKGLEGFEEKRSGAYEFRNRESGKGQFDGATNVPAANIHPTVKPVKLMQYLVRLVTPVGGTCLDPFNGSGTTGIACKLEGMEYVGIELDPEYCKIAEARIEAWEPDEEQLRLV